MRAVMVGSTWVHGCHSGGSTAKAHVLLIDHPSQPPELLLGNRPFEELLFQSVDLRTMGCREAPPVRLDGRLEVLHELPRIAREAVQGLGPRSLRGNGVSLEHPDSHEPDEAALDRRPGEPQVVRDRLGMLDVSLNAREDPVRIPGHNLGEGIQVLLSHGPAIGRVIFNLSGRTNGSRGVNFRKSWKNELPNSRGNQPINSEDNPWAGEG